MSLIVLAKIIVRVLALATIVGGVVTIPNFVYFLGEARASLGILLIPAFLQIAIGIFLWLIADRLGKSMIGDISSTELTFDVSAGELQSIAIVTLGIVLLVANLPVLVGQVFQYVSLSSLDGDNEIVETQMQIGFIISMLKLGLGLVLIFGVRPIVRFLRSLRYIGLEHKD